MFKISLLFLSIWFLSCNTEKSIVKKTLKHKEQLFTVSGELILAYQNSSNEIFLGVTDSLDTKYCNFLGNKLKLPWVHIVYGQANTFIDTDSVIMFTRSGLPVIGSQHDILIDFKQIPRSDFLKACGSCEIVKKIGDRMFYLKSPMPSM